MDFSDADDGVALALSPEEKYPPMGDGTMEDGTSQMGEMYRTEGPLD